jgi:hypothetical protein
MNPEKDLGFWVLPLPATRILCRLIIFGKPLEVRLAQQLISAEAAIVHRTLLGAFEGKPFKSTKLGTLTNTVLSRCDCPGVQYMRHVREHFSTELVLQNSASSNPRAKALQLHLEEIAAVASNHSFKTARETYAGVYEKQSIGGLRLIELREKLAFSRLYNTVVLGFGDNFVSPKFVSQDDYLVQADCAINWFVSLAHVLCRLGPFIARKRGSKGSTPGRSARLHSRTNLSSSSTLVGSFYFYLQCLLTSMPIHANRTLHQPVTRLSASQLIVAKSSQEMLASIIRCVQIKMTFHLDRLLMYYVNRRLHQTYSRLSTSRRSANSSQRHNTGNFWCVWIMLSSHCVACSCTMPSGHWNNRLYSRAS